MLTEEKTLSELVERLAEFGEEHRDHRADLAICDAAIQTLKDHHRKLRLRAETARADARDAGGHARASELRREADALLARLEAAVQVKELLVKVETLGSQARSTARRFNHVHAAGVAVTQEL